jgi:hypothetical protein
MKPILICIAVALAVTSFTGCTGCSAAGGLVDVATIEVDGCEYVYFSTSTGSGGITHKANCKNIIHREARP